MSGPFDPPSPFQPQAPVPPQPSYPPQPQQPPYQQAPPQYQQQPQFQQQQPYQPAAAQPGLSDNAAGGLAYVFIPAILFLIVAPYNRNRFVRFHSWQCIMLAIAWLVVEVGLMVLGRIPGVGLVDLFIGPLVGLCFFVVWLMAMIQAFTGKMFKLPIVGDLAQKQADS